MEEKEIKPNGNGKVEIPLEALELMDELKRMDDSEGIAFPLNKLAHLANDIMDIDDKVSQGDIKALA